MKFLIWSIAAIICSILVQAVSYVKNPDDIWFAAAIVGILVGGVFYVARRLVKSWEARSEKNTKANPEDVISVSTKSEEKPESRETLVVPATDAPVTPPKDGMKIQPESSPVSEMIPCQYCHAEIERKSEYCFHCGKKQIKSRPLKRKGNKRLVLVSVLCIIVLILAGMNIFQFIKYEKLVTMKQETFEQKESEISELKKKLEQKSFDNSMLQMDLDRANESLQEAFDKIYFLNNNIAIVISDGTKLYHRYGCSKTTSLPFLAYNTEAAKGMGYSPCPFCF